MPGGNGCWNIWYEHAQHIGAQCLGILWCHWWNSANVYLCLLHFAAIHPGQENCVS